MGEYNCVLLVSIGGRSWVGLEEGVGSDWRKELVKNMFRIV